MHNVHVCRLSLRLLFGLKCALPMLDTSMGVNFVVFGEDSKYADAGFLCNSMLNVPFGCGPLGLKLHIYNLIDTGQHQRTHVLSC